MYWKFNNVSFFSKQLKYLHIHRIYTFETKYDFFYLFQQYENYSFEELRVAAPAVPRPSENMLVRSNNDGTYMVNWTPGSVGLYNIHVTIDGFDTGWSWGLFCLWCDFLVIGEYGELITLLPLWEY